jgi:hypothetical protein
MDWRGSRWRYVIGRLLDWSEVAEHARFSCIPSFPGSWSTLTMCARKLGKSTTNAATAVE